MKNILLIISVLFFFNFAVSAKSEFLKCDNFLFNIKMPIVGFDKVYIYKKNQWVKVKKFDITEKQYLIFNLEAYLLKCENEKCKVNIAISKVAEGKSYTEYKIPEVKNIIKIISEEGLIVFGKSDGDKHRSSPWRETKRHRITIAFDIIPIESIEYKLQGNHFIPFKI